MKKTFDKIKTAVTQFFCKHDWTYTIVGDIDTQRHTVIEEHVATCRNCGKKKTVGVDEWSVEDEYRTLYETIEKYGIGK